jgi:hypothetical protein
MPKVTLRLTISLLAFAVGVAAAALWLTRRAPKAEKPAAPVCQWPFTSDPQAAAGNRPYFPAGTFYSHKKADEMAQDFNSARLAAMNEPVLSSLTAPDVEIYRFSWFRSFHPAVAVRLWRAGSERCMSVKQLDGLGEFQGDEYVPPRSLAVDQVRPLTAGEWDKFSSLLEGADFWGMSGKGDGARANDGASWIMEGVRNRQYHVVERQSPKDTTYGKAGVYLIRISGVRVDESRAELY